MESKMRLALLLLIVLAVAGCGRRGALEPPPDPALRSGEQPSSRTADEVPPERRRFILDPLI